LGDAARKALRKKIAGGGSKVITRDLLSSFVGRDSQKSDLQAPSGDRLVCLPVGTQPHGGYLAPIPAEVPGTFSEKKTGIAYVVL
jgi:hypothetical protein